ncbi:Urea transporter [Trinorchestia longiramus]|nr:Urea transporter [Trinorchestia longiramus]
MKRPLNRSPLGSSFKANSPSLYRRTKHTHKPSEKKEKRHFKQDNRILPTTLDGQHTAQNELNFLREETTDPLQIYNYNFPFNLQVSSTTTMIEVSNTARDESGSIIQNNTKANHQFWLTGDMQYVTDFFDRWSFLSLMLPLKLLNAALRCFGTPLLINNPISGVFIAAAIFIDQPSSLTWAGGSLVVGYVMCVVFLHPQHFVSSGQSTQHAFLLGLLASTAFDSDLHRAFPTVVFVAVMAAVSVLLGTALTTILARSGLPAMTLSYAFLAGAVCILLKIPDPPQGDLMIKHARDSLYVRNLSNLNLDFIQNALQTQGQGKKSIYIPMTQQSGSYVPVQVHVTNLVDAGSNKQLNFSINKIPGSGQLQSGNYALKSKEKFESAKMARKTSSGSSSASWSTHDKPPIITPTDPKAWYVNMNKLSDQTSIAAITPISNTSTSLTEEATQNEVSETPKSSNDTRSSKSSRSTPTFKETSQKPKKKYLMKPLSFSEDDDYDEFHQEEKGDSMDMKRRKRKVNWKLVLLGAVRGAGQVFRCSGLISSALVLAAIFVFSPTMLFMGFLGGACASLTGVLLEMLSYGGVAAAMMSPQGSLVRSGHYAQQGLLTSASLGGYFFVLTPHSAIVALGGAILAAILTRVMFLIGFPLLTFPHILTTLVLLQTRVRGGHLRQVHLQYLSFPERHRQVFQPADALRPHHDVASEATTQP